jgi:ProP effector
MTTLTLERRPVLGSSVAATRALLCRRFPACFKPRGMTKRPLKIGITDDIVAATGFPSDTVKAAVADYCSGPLYLRGLVAGAIRVDLRGEPCSTVSPKDAAHARRRLRQIGADAPRQSSAP